MADELEVLVRRGNAAAVLKHIRTKKIKAPLEVVRFGRDLVERGAGRLGDDAWSVYEQVFMAALELNDQPLADVARKRLEAKFSESARVARLRGMQLESLGLLDEAEAVYTKLLEKDPVDPLSWKRLAVVSRSRGDVAGAAKRLSAYLRVFQADAQAWQELADLYMLAGDVAAAAFCYEELLLLSPVSHLLHTRLAELYHTQGGHDNLRAARKHYCHSLELQPDANLRALYGVMQTCHGLASSKRDKSDGPVNAAVFKLAAKRVKEHYTAHNADMLPAVEASIEALSEVVLTST